MRLTLSLWKRKMPNGFIWTGKHRLGHHAYAENIERFVKRLQIEEKNMYLLRHPFLTLEQEHGHAKALGKPKQFDDRMVMARASKAAMRSTRIEDKFSHLQVTNSWEI